MAKKLFIENDEALPAIIYAETAPDNFTDYTSDMEAWNMATNIMDWSRRRDMILPLFYAESGSQLENFSSMSNEKKILGCVYFLIPYSIRTLIITEEQDLFNWGYLLTQTKGSRVSCIESMRIHVGQYIRTGSLTLIKTQSFFKDVSTYINWFQEANVPDFKLWISGSSPYEGIFEGKDYYSEDLKNELLDIYNGNY